VKDWEDIRTAPIGSIRDRAILNRFYARIMGSTVPPGVGGMGYSVIVGERAEDGALSEYYVLDEFESPNIRDLIQWSVACWRPYGPSVWFGDPRAVASRQFVQDFNTSMGVGFAFTPSVLADMPQLYSYILPTVQSLLKPTQRRAFLGTSLVRKYLSRIKLDELISMKPGDMPAVEALGVLLSEAEHQIKGLDFEDDMTRAESYAPKSVFR
jgi:hypothetical protein